MPTHSKCAVGVVIPVFNRPSCIVPTLQSMLEQSVPPRQIVIVNDGSTDNTAQVILEWIKQAAHTSSEIRLLDLPHGGVGFARNQGFAMLRDCNAVLFLDSDDIPAPNFLEVVSATLDAHPDAVAASGGLELENDIPLNQYMFYMGSEVASNTLFRCSIVEKYGVFDEALLTGQDLDLFIKISSNHTWLIQPGTSVVRADSYKPTDTGRLREGLFMYRTRWAFGHESLAKHAQLQNNPSLRIHFYHTMNQRWLTASESCAHTFQQYFPTVPKIVMAQVYVRHIVKYVYYRVLELYFKYIVPRRN